MLVLRKVARWFGSKTHQADNHYLVHSWHLIELDDPSAAGNSTGSQADLVAEWLWRNR